MITIGLRFTRITLLVLGMSCVSTPRAAGGRRGDVTAITEEQLAQRHYQNLFEAVQALRSNWLSSRGTDSFQTPSQVWVYVDDTRVGGLETLASIPIQGVASVTHLNGIDATARWGLGHAAGVISVHTWPTGARDTTADATAVKENPGAHTP